MSPILARNSLTIQTDIKVHWMFKTCKTWDKLWFARLGVDWSSQQKWLHSISIVLCHCSGYATTITTAAWSEITIKTFQFVCPFEVSSPPTVCDRSGLFVVNRYSERSLNTRIYRNLSLPIVPNNRYISLWILIGIWIHNIQFFQQREREREARRRISNKISQTEAQTLNCKFVALAFWRWR